jgi:DNA-binding XRE family transcriptional regulator
MKKPLTNVKIELIKQGMTQKELAAKVGITEEYLSKIVNQKNTPSVTIALKISDALTKTVEELFSEQEQRKGSAGFPEAKRKS